MHDDVVLEAGVILDGREITTAEHFLDFQRQVPSAIPSMCDEGALHLFDVKLKGWAARYGIVYTRDATSTAKTAAHPTDPEKKGRLKRQVWNCKGAPVAGGKRGGAFTTGCEHQIVARLVSSDTDAYQQFALEVLPPSTVDGYTTGSKFGHNHTIKMVCALGRSMFSVRAFQQHGCQTPCSNTVMYFLFAQMVAQHLKERMKQNAKQLRALPNSNAQTVVALMNADQTYLLQRGDAECVITVEEARHRATCSVFVHCAMQSVLVMRGVRAAHATCPQILTRAPAHTPTHTPTTPTTQVREPQRVACCIAAGSTVTLFRFALYCRCAVAYLVLCVLCVC